MKPEHTPMVTVLMANYNGARHLAAAVNSALRQTFTNIEVLIVDDASIDDSVAIARGLAANDRRIRVIQRMMNGGPGAARNLGLEAARGVWIAIQDSDDLMDPLRIARLVSEAERTGAEMVADDLLVFYEGRTHRPHRFLRGSLGKRSAFIDVATYVRSGALYTSAPKLGVLKPLFRADALRRTGLQYNPRLRIGEDFDLVTRALTAGLRLWIDPFPGYLYRKHAASISHMMEASHVEDLLAGIESSARSTHNARLARALAFYHASLLRARGYAAVVDALKARKLGQALRELLAEPRTLWLLRLPVVARLKRLGSQLDRWRRPQDPGHKAVCVLSRQRLVGGINGSSAYLLTIARGLRKAGFTVHLVQPSPVVFGRRPWLRMRPEMGVFASHVVRGGVRLGSFFVCTRPTVWMAAARGLVARLLDKLRMPSAFLGAAPAEYAIAAPLKPQDLVFTVRHAPRGAVSVLTDYAFQNELIPYAMSDGPSVVIMHDLFCRRGAQFSAQSERDSVIALDEAEEIALLGTADIVAAIQSDEAGEVARHLGNNRVIVLPMGMQTVSAAAPGRKAELFFVGSNTAPNVVGLKWFFDGVWPIVTSRSPGARLTVAGSVADALQAVPAGVTLAGVVSDLGPFYERAAVVVSPLTAGSGLKIKLIEAMAYGKAIVATPVTLQGCQELSQAAVVCAESAPAFAEAICSLLADPGARARLGEHALGAARSRYGEQAACAGLVAALTRNWEPTGKDAASG